MPVRRLPDSPNLDHLKTQAKDLRREHAARSRMAAQRLREFHPRFLSLTDDAIFAAAFAQSDALLAVAREYGYSSWPRLKAHVEGPMPADRWSRPQQELIGDPVFRLAVELIDAGDAAGLGKLLKEHPALVHQRVAFEGGNYFHSATLLNFVAENPVRNGRLPSTIADVAWILLEAGPDQESKNETLMLVATGSVARECGVQRELIMLLCSFGANADAATEPAALHMEPDSVQAMLELGAAMTLTVAASLGRMEEFVGLLPLATAAERHLALSMAAQSGHAEIVALLLDAGEDPNRYNPPGGHSHATPLHQAVAFGHVEVVRLLLERGARVDVEDVLWRGTPLGWLRHSEHKDAEIEALLVARESQG